MCGCSDEKNCYDNQFADITAFESNPDEITPNGVLVTTNGWITDLERIDLEIAYMEACLEMTLKRDCFEVIIPPEIHVSSCSREQLFECDIVEANYRYLLAIGYSEEVARERSDICRYDKGLETSDECPCMCRATIQNENIIITTPNLKLFSAELARMMTGELNVYNNERTVACLDGLQYLH